MMNRVKKKKISLRKGEEKIVVQLKMKNSRLIKMSFVGKVNRMLSISYKECGKMAKARVLQRIAKERGNFKILWYTKFFIK